MVSVPRIQRAQPTSALLSNDRINMQVKDSGSAILNQTAQVTKIGDTAGDLYQEYENDKIETLSTTLEKGFKDWNSSELERLKGLEGDPTVNYAEYEKKAKEKYDEMIASSSDVSDRVKRHVTSRFDKTFYEQGIAAKKQRGMQQEVYDNNMFEASVKTKKDDLPVVAGYVSKDDPTSFAMFEGGMNDIKTIVAKRGLKKGTVTRLPDDAKSWTHAYRDDDGNMVKVQMSDIAKQRVAKELSEGVKNSLDALIAGGQIEEAKTMRERYKNVLDPASANKVAAKLEKAGRKDEAYGVIQSLRNKSEDEQIAAIEKISDPELRSEVLKRKDADDNRLQSMRERKAKVNYDKAATYVLDKMNSDQPFYGIADLESDPVVNGMWDHLDAKGKKAITEMIQAPKESNEKSLTRVRSLFLGESDADLENMSVQEFHSEYLTGLSKADKQRAFKEFARLKKPSAAEERASIKTGNELVKRYMLLKGDIEENDYGRIEGEDKELLMTVQDELMERLSTFKTQPNSEQISKLAKELVGYKIAEKTFRPKAPAKAPASQNSGQTAIPANTINENPLDGMSATQVINLKAEFERKYGFTPKKADPRFIKFAQGNKG